MLVLNYKQDKGFTEGQTETLKVRENGSTFFPFDVDVVTEKNNGRISEDFDE